MEMFYNTDLLLNNNLNRDMILKRFEKSSKSEKTLIRIAMNLYRGCIDEDFKLYIRWGKYRYSFKCI